MQELTIQQIKQFQHWLVDSVWNHFIAQDKPFGYDHHYGRCNLRTSTGNKCALGIFIDDETYKTIDEYQIYIAQEIIALKLFSFKPAGPDGIYLDYYRTMVILSDLQTKHDTYSFENDKQSFATSLILLKAKIEKWN